MYNKVRIEWSEWNTRTGERTLKWKSERRERTVRREERRERSARDKGE